MFMIRNHTVLEKSCSSSRNHTHLRNRTVLKKSYCSQRFMSVSDGLVDQNISYKHLFSIRTLVEMSIIVLNKYDYSSETYLFQLPRMSIVNFNKVIYSQ